MAAEQTVTVNELLCFLANNLHNSSFDDIVKCCANFYSCKEIVAAKDLVFNSANHPKKRNIARRAAAVSKEVADTSDIVDLLLSCDAENIPLPTFAAVNLSNLPTLPVSDVDIRGVYKELSCIKDSLECLSEKVLSKPRCARALSSARGDERAIDGAKGSTPPVRSALATPTPSSPILPNFTKVLRSPKAGDKKPTRERRGIVGSATNISAVGLSNKVLKASPRKRSFYVGRFDTDTTDTDIKNYLAANRPKLSVVAVLRLPNTETFGYNAFKVTCEGMPDDSVILDSALWPAGICCRVFFEPRISRKN